MRLGIAQHGPRAQLLELGDVVRDPLGETRGQPGAQLGDEGALLCDIRNHALGGIGGGGRAHVGDVVEERVVVLVPDRADDREWMPRPPRAASRSSLKPSSVCGSPPPRAITITSTSGSASSAFERTDRLGDAAIALHRGVRGAEPHLRPPQLGVAAHVLLGIRFLAGDEADDVREEGDPLLARRVEQPLGAKLSAKALEPLQLIAESDVAHRRDAEGEVAGLDEVVGLHAGDDVVADLEVGGQALPGR